MTEAECPICKKPIREDSTSEFVCSGKAEDPHCIRMGHLLVDRNYDVIMVCGIESFTAKNIMSVWRPDGADDWVNVWRRGRSD